MDPGRAHPEPSPAQAEWQALGFGLAINFGARTVGAEDFRPRDFGRTRPAPEQWVDVASEAGARYLVLNVKAADGFCVWPSRYTQWCTRQLRSRPDLIETVAAACADAGLGLGLSYSLIDHHCPFYADDARYTDYVLRQLDELLGNYGTLLQVSFEGAEDKVDPLDSNRQAKAAARWAWPRLYARIHQRQPNCLVLAMPRPSRPGTVPFFPADLRGAADWDLVADGRLCHPVLNPLFTRDREERFYLPLEVRGSLTPDGWPPAGGQHRQPGPTAINDWLRRARAVDANFLLTVAPTPDGRIPPAAVHHLQLAARERRH